MSEQPLVLVVEDEYFLKLDLEQSLNDAGFATEAVSSGEEALTLFLGDTGKYRMLMTDVRLCDAMGGWQLARIVRATEPALPVIYVTGSSAEDWALNGVPNSILIQKPFTRARLIGAVRNLLNVGTSSAV